MHHSRSKLVGILISALLAGTSPAEDDAAYRAGIGLLSRGLHDLAAPELRKYLNANPDGKEAANAHYALGVCLVRLGRHAQAAPELELVSALPGFEFAPDATFLLAQCAAAQGNNTQAAELLASLTRNSPDYASLDSAYQLLGEVLFRTGDFQASLAASRRVPEQWPRSPVVDRARLFVAMSAMSTGEYSVGAEAAHKLTTLPDSDLAARGALLEAQCRQRTGDDDRVMALFEQAAASEDPIVRGEALLGVAQAARLARQHDKATAALDRIGTVSPAGDLASRASLERGRVLLESGRLEQAQRVFEGIRSQELADDAAYWAARCAFAQGQFARASDLLGAAMRTYPNSELLPSIAFDRALAKSRAGDDAGAFGAWSTWLESYPGHALRTDALAAAASCAHRLGRFEESIELSRAFLDSSASHAKGADVSLLIAENEYRLGRFDLAERAFAALSERSPRGDLAWRATLRRGLCLAELGKASEAESLLKRAVEARDADPALRAAGLSELGDLCAEREAWAESAEWFGALAGQLEDAPGRDSALLREGIAFARAGEPERALPSLTRAAESGDAPCALHARFELAQAMLVLGQLDKARPEFERVVELERGAAEPVFAPHALRNLASIASREGRADDAAAILGALASADGSSSDAALDQGTAFLAAGKFDRAEAVFSEYLSAHADSSRASEALARHAIALGRLGRSEQALKEMEVAAASKGIDAELSASLLYERSVILRAIGKDKEADGSLDALLSSSPAARLAAHAALDRAQSEVNAGRHDAALALLGRCDRACNEASPADMSPVRRRAAYLRAVSLLGLSRPAEACAALESIPDAGDDELANAAALIRAEALLKTGRAAEAVGVLDGAVKRALTPQAAGPALLRLGEACAESQQWARSERAFTEYLHRVGESDDAYRARFGLGWAQENQGRHDAAIVSYGRVVSTHQGPTAARAQFQIGECLFAQSDLERAAAELLKVDVLYAYPEWSAAALFEAGRCFERMGRTDDALRQFDSVVERFPETPWAKAAREKIDAAAPTPLPGRPGRNARTP